MKISILVLTFLMAQFASATVVRGRIDFGGLIATERFSSDAGGSTSNDSQVISSEFYLKAIGINDSPWEFTSDLRDKNDFFGKANQELLQLQNANAFQVQELNTKYVGAHYMFTFGRFHVQEVGLPGVDGVRFEVKSRDWVSGVFTGYNAETVDQRYYQWNGNTNVTGVSSTYQRRDNEFDKNLFFSHGLVNEMEDGAVDRTYLFHNAIYQWNRQSRLISLVYFDFVPNPYIQNGNVIWQQGLNNKWSSQLNLLGIDVIAYSHRQSVRERLVASPYKEASGKLDYQLNPLSKIEFGASDGERSADGLNRQEYYVGFEKGKIFNRHYDLVLRGGTRKNFISNDVFANAYLTYFSRGWEGGLDAETGVESYNDGVVKHPLTIELDYSRFISRSLYLTVSASRDADETVEVYTGFFKIGYRFGTSSISPPHDTPPLRGQL